MSQQHFLSIARRLQDGTGSNSDVQIPAASTGFFYSGAQREHQLESVRHMACFSDLLLVLSGPVGAGKSCLLSQVKKRYESELNIVSFASAPELSPAELVQLIAAQSRIFARPDESVESLLKRCVASYRSLYADTARKTLLMIDDAHRIAPALLKGVIKSLGLGEADSPVVLLLSTSKDLVWLADEYGSDAIHLLSLSALNKNELRDYIAGGLADVGYTGALEIDDISVQYLMAKTQGWPANIETHMASVLFGEHRSSASTASDHRTKVPVAALATIVLVLLGSFIFVAQQHNLFAGIASGLAGASHDNALSAVDQDAEAQKQRLAMLDKAIKQSEKFEQNAVITSGAVSASEEIAVDDAAAVEAVEESSVVLDDGALVVASDPEVVTEIDPPVSSEADDTALAKRNNEGLSADAPTSASGDIETVSTSMSLSVEEGSNEPVSDLGVKRVTTVAGGSNTTEGVKRTQVLKSKPIVHQGFRDASWIETNSAGYTMQVLGSYNESTAQRYIEDNASLKLVYIRSTYKGKPWYVVLYGVFDSPTSARAERLPDILAKEKPWIRNVSGLK